MLSRRPAPTLRLFSRLRASIGPVRAQTVSAVSRRHASGTSGAFRKASGFPNRIALYAGGALAVAGVVFYQTTKTLSGTKVVTSHTRAQVAKHNTRESCWVIINNKVYDVTEYIQKHPGGAGPILRKAGQDATKEFEMIHPSGTLKENGFVPIGEVEPLVNIEPDRPKVSLPCLEAMMNLNDFEQTASKVLPPEGWAYYYSGSDDLYTKVLNSEIFQKVFLRPRIFVDVTDVDTSSSIAGYETTLPVFVSPAAQAKLAHQSGERGIAEACGKEGILQMVSNHSSMGFEEIVDNPIDEDQKFIYQLYVNDDRAVSEKKLRRVVETGRCHAVVLTLDAPTPGKRELDEKLKIEGKEFDPEIPFQDLGNVGIGQQIFAGTAADLTWKDLKWLRDQLPEDMPILLKGIQTYEDAILASRVSPKVTGIILSNHGGRALDQSQPSLLVLEELRKNSPEVFDKLEVYLDGGVRRGTDVVKALCLGAKQVGIGRPALFGLAGYGEPGVERVIQIMRREIEIAMRLLGVHSIEELGPHHLNTKQLDQLVYTRK